MAKYVHQNLSRFIKSDAKKIKEHNPHLKNTDIANTLATFFGWRHFNELKKNSDKDHIFYDNSFTKISSMKFNELNELKNKYIIFIDKTYGNRNDENYIYDKYNIHNGGFGRLKNKAVTYLKKIDNSPVLDISLLHNETYIKLSNDDVASLLLETLNKKKDSDDTMWFHRSNLFINVLLNALKHDENKDSINYQEFFKNIWDINFLSKYVGEYKNKSKCEDLIGYLYSLPGYLRPYVDNGKEYKIEDIEQDFGVSEQHGYIAMYSLYILKQSFFNKHERNKQVLNLSELRSYKGTIRVTHVDTGDISNDLKILSKIL